LKEINALILLFIATVCLWLTFFKREKEYKNVTLGKKVIHYSLLTFHFMICDIRLH